MKKNVHDYRVTVAFRVRVRFYIVNEISKNPKAIKLLRRSLVIREKFHDSSRISYSWASLGMVNSSISMYDSAEYCFSQSQPNINVSGHGIK